MSVFTTVTSEQLNTWLQDYRLGELLELRGIAAGISNTNYFVTTRNGRYVLTLFENTPAAELPIFLELMAHLADRGIPCPRPLANLKNTYLGWLNGKPATLVSRLHGTSVETPAPSHCAATGAMLARLHLAGQSFPRVMENPRGLCWREATARAVMPFLHPAQRRLLEQELAYQAGFSYEALPRGVIHADLFRDNVLFADGQLTGVVDFYFACNEAWAQDLTIAANDWCLHDDGRLDATRLSALLQAYHAVRPLSDAEQRAWPGLLRAGALCFWLSRLYDLHHPRPGELTYAKDPEHFRRILSLQAQSNDGLTAIWPSNHNREK